MKLPAGEMIDITDAQAVHVLISPHGHRLWVCTENGTVLRIKLHRDSCIELEDQRVEWSVSVDDD